MPAELLAQRHEFGPEPGIGVRLGGHLRRAESQQVGQGARFRLLDQAESGPQLLGAGVAGEGQRDQALVERLLVAGEGDLQLVGGELATQALENGLRLAVGRLGGGGVPARLRRLPGNQTGLELQGGSAACLQVRERGGAMPVRFARVVARERQPGLQDLAAGHAGRQILRRESGMRQPRQAAGLLDAALPGHNPGPVEIHDAAPDAVGLALEAGLALGEQAERLLRQAAAGDRKSPVGERFGGLVLHAQSGEALEGAYRQPLRLQQEVELETDLGLVEVAERPVMPVPLFLAVGPRLLESPQGAGVLAAQVVEIGDVVLDLEGGDGEAVLAEVAARLIIGSGGSLEIVQILVADRQIAQRPADVARLAVELDLFVARLEMLERLGETVLACLDVAEIEVQPGEA